MKYLAHFLPSEELHSLLSRQKHTKFASSGLHATICFFHMPEENQSGLISDLAKIDFEPFEIETQSFDDFDKDSLVLRLSRPEGLINLHMRILSAVKRYASPEFQEIEQRYFGGNYNPHLTIAKSSSEFDRSTRELFGHRSIVSEYWLSRKNEDSWVDLASFRAAKS